MTEEGMTTIGCEWKMIDHSQGDQYLFFHVTTEVPTVAGDWSDMNEVADVFEGLRDSVKIVEDAYTGNLLELDEGFTYYREGVLVS